MLLVADSGSTKADWKLADNGKVITSFSSMGFNPFFHTGETVYNALYNMEVVRTYSNAVKQIYFFGSGCSHPTRNMMIADGLKRVFVNAAVFVGHDLDACAYATCGTEPGIACILGTGSNSCFFDGKEVHEFNHGLGFIIGDEGSASYFGKKLLAYFLYKILPQDLYTDFEQSYKLNKEIIIENVYKKPNPNVFMASFAVFMEKHKEHPYIQNMISKGLGEFMDVNVCNIPNYKNYPVHFIGSIAFYYADILKQEATKRGITLGEIIQKPIDNLMEYFLRKENTH